MTGYVLWFNRKKGHGVIVKEDSQTIFVHHRDIAEQDGFKVLKKGDKVMFDVGTFKDTLNCAKNVKIIK